MNPGQKPVCHTLAQVSNQLVLAAAILCGGTFILAILSVYVAPGFETITVIMLASFLVTFILSIATVLLALILAAATGHLKETWRLLIE